MKNMINAKMKSMLNETCGKQTKITSIGWVQQHWPQGKRVHAGDVTVSAVFAAGDVTVSAVDAAGSGRHGFRR